MYDHNEPADPTRPRLDRQQLTRLALARRDLNEAREADLAALESAAMVLLVERLRGALDDTMRLIDELAR